MNFNEYSPSLDLYHRVRAGFVLQGDSLGTWCRKRSICPNNARSALVGNWNGPKGQALRKRLIEASGIASSLVRA